MILGMLAFLVMLLVFLLAVFASAGVIFLTVWGIIALCGRKERKEKDE